MSDKYIIEGNNFKYAFTSLETGVAFLDGIESIEKNLESIKEKIKTKEIIENIISEELDLDPSNPKNIQTLLTVSEISSRYANQIISRKIGLNEAKSIIRKTFSSIEIDDSNQNEYLNILDEIQSHNIKLSLFESLKKLVELFESEIFKNEGDSKSNAVEAIDKVIDMSYSVSKDWIVLSDKTEKEHLLSKLLPMVTDIYIDTYIDNVLKLTEKNLRIYSEKDFWDNQKQLSSIIESMDMGYQNGGDVNLSWLKNRMYGSIEYYVSLFASKASFLKDEKLEDFKSLMFEKMTVLAIDSWMESGNSYLDQCNGMTEEEFNAWAKNEGSKPMPYEKFLKSLEEKTLENSGLLHDGSIDLNEVNKETKDKVSLLWGMSDAIFKMSKVNEI